MMLGRPYVTAREPPGAGPAFVEALISRRSEVEPMLRASVKHFHSDAAERFGLRDDGQTARAAERLALIAAAGELATTFGLTGWPAGTAPEAALEILGSWLVGRGGAGPAEAREAVARVRAFIVAHGDARFERIDEGGFARDVANRAGWRDKDTFYIATDAWVAIHRGADPKRAAQYVRAAGFLRPGDGKNLPSKAPRIVNGRPRVYAVLGDIMGAGED